MAALNIELGAATRAYPGEAANGDNWAVDWIEGSCRIALIDGLGHGPLAADVAAEAVSALHAQPQLAPVQALGACDGALHGSRGAAISIVRIAADGLELTFAGIGNVEGQLRQADRSTRLVPDRGIVGTVHRSQSLQSRSLIEPWILVLYSDGIRSRFSLAAIDDAMTQEPNAIASAVLSQWARELDDATVVVVRPRLAASGAG